MVPTSEDQNDETDEVKRLTPTEMTQKLISILNKSFDNSKEEAMDFFEAQFRALAQESKERA